MTMNFQLTLEDSQHYFLHIEDSTEFVKLLQQLLSESHFASSRGNLKVIAARSER